MLTTKAANIPIDNRSRTPEPYRRTVVRRSKPDLQRIGLGGEPRRRGIKQGKIVRLGYKLIQLSTRQALAAAGAAAPKASTLLTLLFPFMNRQAFLIGIQTDTKLFPKHNTDR